MSDIITANKPFSLPAVNLWDWSEAYINGNILTVITTFPNKSFPYSPSIESITQYIIDLSKDIYRSIQEPEQTALYSSKGEVRLRILLSPWGELKDAYISESSENVELDSLCLNAVWLYQRYQPFPEAI